MKNKKGKKRETDLGSEKQTTFNGPTMMLV